MAESKRLPLKVVPTLDKDFYYPESGGGPKKVFTSVTPEFRQRLSSQVIDIRDHFGKTFREFPKVPAVARVRVREDAVAKSHRPTEVFTAATCPIIGAEGLGDLLVSVTNVGLENLARKIETNRTKQTVANLSTLESLEAYAPTVDRPKDNVAKVKLFRHNQQVLDAAIDETFYELLRTFGVREPHPLHYGRGLKIYRIEVQRPELIDTLQTYVGTQSIGPFPLYGPVRSTAVTIRSMTAEDFPAPVASMEYPVVGMIDSGTAPGDPFISPWRVAWDVHVAEEEQDNTHGSLVAGLIVHARQLNRGDDRFPLGSARIVDVVALGKNGTTEDKLISTLEQALEAHPEVKVWNLSLGTEKGVADRAFSDLGVALDRLQDEYRVTFIIAAGNYRNPPFRGWPPDDLGEADRVCAPADSVRAVVVLSSPNLCPRFERH
jgi:serine protease AprX